MNVSVRTVIHGSRQIGQKTVGGFAGRVCSARATASRQGVTCAARAA